MWSGRHILALPLLEIDRLVCGYEGGVVLEQLSLQVGEGEVLAVLGRNGVGKTTLLKTIMGLVATSSGRVVFSGQSISNLEPYQIARKGIGYVPQGREIFAEFTVLENLAMGNLGTDDFSDVFKLFPVLEQRQSSQAGTFSGGQQQQLAIARALVARPKLLLLDEPLEGLQPSIVSEISEILKHITSTMNMGILLVEQNIDMVFSIAERCIFIEGGSVERDHTVAELRENPRIIEGYLGI